MSDMLYVIVILAILILALLLLRLRVRLELSSERRLLFVGLGRSGPEFELGRQRGQFRLFGLKVRSFVTEKKRPTVGEKTAEKKKAQKALKTAGQTRPKKKRPFKEILRIIPQCSQALWFYFVDLLKALIVEEAEGELSGGFDSPDLTGCMFGFYQAALGVVPGMVGRVRFVPDWTGASLAGSARCVVALPLYRLISATVMLLWRLPVMKIIKLAIGEREGVQDGKQRS